MKYKRNNTTNKKTKRRLITKLSLIWPMIIIFIVVNILIMLKSATLGAELVEVEKKIEILAKQKRQIESEILEQSSLLSMKERADELKFNKAENILYLEQDTEIAKLPL